MPSPTPKQVVARRRLVAVGARIGLVSRAARLRTALRLWLRDGDEQRVKRAKLRRGLGLLRNRLLAMAWQGWRASLHAAKLLRRRLVPFAARLVNRRASLSYSNPSPDYDPTPNLNPNPNPNPSPNPSPTPTPTPHQTQRAHAVLTAC